MAVNRRILIAGGAAIAGAAFVPRRAFAQAPATEPRTAITVSGTVRDISGSVVADASVFLEEKATNASVEARTKSDGTFSFSAPRTLINCRMRI